MYKKDARKEPATAVLRAKFIGKRVGK